MGIESVHTLQYRFFSGDYFFGISKEYSILSALDYKISDRKPNREDRFVFNLLILGISEIMV